VTRRPPTAEHLAPVVDLASVRARRPPVRARRGAAGFTVTSSGSSVAGSSSAAVPSPPVTLHGRTGDHVTAALAVLARVRPLVCVCGRVEGDGVPVGAAVVRGPRGTWHVAARCVLCEPDAGAVEVLPRRVLPFASVVRASPPDGTSTPREGDG
jgi:hypothetical protein